MPPPYYRLARSVTLLRSCDGYNSPKDAHEMDYAAIIDVPPDDYRVIEIRRNEDDWHDQDRGDGYYYLMAGGGGRFWVRQQELFCGELDAMA